MKKLTAKILPIILAVICIASAGSVEIAHAAGTPRAVDVIDSIVIMDLYDTDKVLAEWQSLQPDITLNHAFTSAQAVKLFINWSDHGGAIDLQSGDYFTFVIPSVFDHSKVSNVTDKAITDSSDNVVATYSIYTNAQGRKEVKVTFTDFVDTHTDISGNVWMVLYVGKVESTEIKDLEFVINGELEASGNVTVNPEQPTSLTPPTSVKYGYPSPARVVNGYYIFEWNINLNMGENSDGTGFNILENFSFEDIIPPNSPHVFITDAIAAELNIPGSYKNITVKEYTGSDDEPPSERYQTFLKRYYHEGDHPWSYDLTSHTLANGVTSDGIDGKGGLNISNVSITDKSIYAKLGRLTRPTVIHYYTIATIKISESALADPETVKFFENTFRGSNEETLHEHLTVHTFVSGGSAKGILGDYSFMFTKLGEGGAALPGAWFSLYTNESCTGGADRFAISDNSGTVAFNNIEEGVYYFRETTAPEGYILDSTIYKVEINEQGYAIYYGDNFENRLQGNRVINNPPTPTPTPSPTPSQPPPVTPPPTNPPTGSANNAGLWIIMLAVACGIILSMLLTAAKPRKI